MKYVLSLVMLVGSLSAQAQKAPQLAPHYTGLGVWHYQGLVTGGDPNKLAQFYKKKGLTFVIVKACDGSEWGVKAYGRRYVQCNPAIFKAFHRQGLRCYAYVSTYLRPRSDVRGAFLNAVRALHEGADGVMYDDVFNYGNNRQQTSFLFNRTRQHLRNCRYCRGKSSDFSTFPHLKRRPSDPWEIPLQMCGVFSPQVYHKTLRKTPRQAFAYSLSSYRWYVHRHAIKKPARFVPSFQAYRGTVKPGDLDQMLKFAKRNRCQGAIVYRAELMSLAHWKVVNKWAAKFYSPPKAWVAAPTTRRRTRVGFF